MPEEPDERQYWLWVTRPDYYLEADRRTDRKILDPSRGVQGWWTCNEKTKVGDLIFLWRTLPKSDIGYLIQAKSKAYPITKENTKGWDFGCDYKVLYKFKNPVTIKDLRNNPEFINWSALKRNFQGINFEMSSDIWEKLDEIALRKNLGYSGYRKFLDMPESSFDTTKKFNANDYVSAFHELQIAPNHLQMLLANYYAPNRTLTATMMAKAMGYYHYSAANLHYGKLGRLVGEKLGWTPLPKFKIEVLVNFEKPGKEWIWTLKPVVAEAIELLGWADEQPTIPEEVDDIEPIYEGAVRKVSVNAYERSNMAREKCLLHYGCKCTVCDIILSDIYGEIAQGYIHVHHLKQLSEINSEYQIDPIVDLRPVCPTCHSIIHLRKPPYSIEEVKELIDRHRDTG